MSKEYELDSVTNTISEIKLNDYDSTECGPDIDIIYKRNNFIDGNLKIGVFERLSGKIKWITIFRPKDVHYSNSLFSVNKVLFSSTSVWVTLKEKNMDSKDTTDYYLSVVNIVDMFNITKNKDNKFYIDGKNPFLK